MADLLAITRNNTEGTMYSLPGLSQCQDIGIVAVKTEKFHCPKDHSSSFVDTCTSVSSYRHMSFFINPL